MKSMLCEVSQQENALKRAKPSLTHGVVAEVLSPKLTRIRTMLVSIELPKAFSVRDEREFAIVSDLVARMHPQLVVAEVAKGVHIHGGATVHWGVVHVAGQSLVENDVQSALQEAGLDFQHNAQIALTANSGRSSRP
jgi:hypothetical protein